MGSKISVNSGGGRDKINRKKKQTPKIRKMKKTQTILKKQKKQKRIKTRDEPVNTEIKFQPPTLEYNPENFNVDKARCQLSQSLWQSSFSSPIEDELTIGCLVLDIGCGSGHWLEQMATQFRLSEFVGLDIIPLDDSKLNTLPNVSFTQANMLDPLPFEDNYFDFVRISSMTLCFTDSEWGGVIKEISRVTKPRGCIEISEPELGVTNRGPILDKILNNWFRYLSPHEINPQITQRIGLYMAATGTITDVEYDIRTCSFGEVAGVAGMVHEQVFYNFFKNEMVTPLSEYMCISENELLEMWQGIAEELGSFQSFIKYYRHWGRKKSR